MNQSVIKATNQAPPQEKRIQSPPPKPTHFKRRIGSTTFKVAVHFNPEAKETAEAKISRLVRMETDSRKAAEA